MRCTNCGREMRIAPEQIGIDVNGRSVYHKHAYCDNCHLKWDIEIPNYGNPKKKNAHPVLVGLGVLGLVIVGVFLCLFLFALISSAGDSDRSRNTIGEENIPNDVFGNLVEEKITADNKELYSKNKIKITFNSIEENSQDYVFDFTIENNRKEDVDLYVSSYSVNNLMVDTIWRYNKSVAAGNNGILELRIEKSWLDENDIEKLRKLDLIFACNKESGDFLFETDTFSIKTNYDDGESYVSSSGELVYSDDELKVWICDQEDYKYYFMIQNLKEDGDFYIGNCNVNQWSYDDILFGLWGERIYSNQYFRFEISLSDNFLEKANITSVESLDFTIQIDDAYKGAKKKIELISE